MMKIRFDLLFLGRYVEEARQFLIIAKGQVNSRLVDEYDGNKYIDIVPALLKAKDLMIGKDLTFSKLASESVLLLIVG